MPTHEYGVIYTMPSYRVRDRAVTAYSAYTLHRDQPATGQVSHHFDMNIDGAGDVLKQADLGSCQYLAGLKVPHMACSSCMLRIMCGTCSHLLMTWHQILIF
jgi:hypothetical protein